MLDRRFAVAFFEGAKPPRVEGGKPWYPVTPTNRMFELSTLSRAFTVARPRPDHKWQVPSWSPVLLAEGSTRKGESVISLSCLTLDYDDGSSIEEASEKWAAHYHIVHTSYNHGPDKTKFRLILPLLTDVQAKHWPAVWDWAEKQSGKKIDRQCKDLCRFYYIPVEGPLYRSLVHEGPLLDLSHLRTIDRPPVSDYAPPVRANRRGDFDPTFRLQAGLSLGGKQRNDVVKGVTCPKCGRKSVWYAISPVRFTGWMCEHRNSCNATGNVADLLKG